MLRRILPCLGFIACAYRLPLVAQGLPAPSDSTAIAAASRAFSNAYVRNDSWCGFVSLMVSGESCMICGTGRSHERLSSAE